MSIGRHTLYNPLGSLKRIVAAAIAFLVDASLGEALRRNAGNVVSRDFSARGQVEMLRWSIDGAINAQRIRAHA
jgi:hypothetical protein